MLTSDANRRAEAEDVDMGVVVVVIVTDEDPVISVEDILY